MKLSQVVCFRTPFIYATDTAILQKLHSSNVDIVVPHPFLWSLFKKKKRIALNMQENKESLKIMYPILLVGQKETRNVGRCCSSSFSQSPPLMKKSVHCI